MMTTKFKDGDKVRRKDGATFSNGKKVVTVDFLAQAGVVWFVETGSWEHMDNIRHVTTSEATTVARQELEKLLEAMSARSLGLEEDIRRSEQELGGLTASIEHVENALENLKEAGL